MFIYSSVSTDWKLNFVVFRFKNCVYTLTLYCGWGEASIPSLEKMSTKEKSPFQTVNIEKNCARWRFVKNYLCVREGYKKIRSKMVNIIAFILTWYAQLFILKSVLSFLNRHTIMLVLNGFPFLCLSCSNLLVIVFFTVVKLINCW